MGRAPLSGELVFLDQIEADEALVRRLRALSAGETVDLAVDGVHGRWRRIEVEIAPGRTLGAIVSAAAQAPQARRSVDIREPQSSSSQLATFGLRYNPWDTPENQLR